MILAHRKSAFLALVGFALCATGCGSNNKGKIEGKWKITELPDKSSAKNKEEFAQLGKLGLYVYIEFKANDAMTIGVGADKPEMLDLIKMSAPNQKISWDAKYKLGSGDTVELYDLPKELAQGGGGGMFGGKDKAKVKIKVEGDTMMMTDEEGTGKLVRVKDQPAAKPGDAKPGDPKQNEK